MTDSVACIPKELAEKYQIEVVPAANIMFDGQTYIDGVTISAAEAYQLLRKDPDRFVTSAITPGQLMEVYRQLSARSQEILFITLASVLSAVFKTASLAADIFKSESSQTTIRVLDSRAVAGTQGLVVLAVAKAVAQGFGLDRVASLVQQVRQKTGGVMMLDTLRYVYRTGRMSKLGARLVSLLNIKPINRLSEEGKIVFVDRVRKREDGYKRLLVLIRNEAGTDALHFMITHADAPEMAERFSELLKQNFNCLSMSISDFSPVMGYGSGPGTLFIGFHPELDLLK
jgi:DegV family protein with EDD domain